MSYVRPISISPEQFRHHAIPRLARLARVHGTFIALGQEGFSAAFSTLFCASSRMGAGLLSRAHQNALESWLFRVLLEEIEQADRLVGQSCSAIAGIEASAGRWCGVTTTPREPDLEGAS
jgi:hypothetical protein